MNSRRVSFDHLVGTGEQRQRHRKTKRLGHFEIDHNFQLGRLLDRQVGWFAAFEDLVDVGRGAAVEVGICAA